MIPYTINMDSRRTILFYLAAAAVATTGLFQIVATSLLPARLDQLASVLSLPSAFAVYGVYYWLFDKHIWAWPLARFLHGIPDLNGKWNGTVTRGESGQEETHVVHARISQTWTGFELDYESENLRSHVTSMSFILKQKAGTELLYAFEVWPKTPAADLRAEGMQRLYLSWTGGVPSLEGKYLSSSLRKGYLKMSRDREHKELPPG